MTRNISIKNMSPFCFDGTIPELVEFETWWNKDLATVIDGSYNNDRFTIWLIIYEPPRRNMGENLVTRKIRCEYNEYNLENTKKAASQARIKLNGENPVSQIFIFFDSHAHFSNIVSHLYVKKEKLPVTKEEFLVPYLVSPLPIERITNDPWNYLKPLDIVKVKRTTLGNKYYHFGIYIGDGEVCHFSDPNSKKNIDNNCVRITGWKTFLGDYDINGIEAVRIHPLIPFRHYQEIAKNIAWDVYNNFGLRRYCLANNNCEHYVYSRIFGVKFSEQVKERPDKSLEYAHDSWLTNYGKCNKCKNGIVNNGESGRFILKNELSNSCSYEKREDSVYREIINQYTQEVPPKSTSYHR